MDPLSILALVEKGISVASMLIEAGKSAAPAFDAIKNLITCAKGGTITDDELTATEALLDSLIDSFDEPI